MREPIPRIDDSAITRATPRRRALPRQTTNLRRGGRETKLTPELADRILSAIRQGSYREIAAQAAGVRPETLSRWMHRDGEPYETFRCRVEKTEADIERRMVRCVTNAAAADPKYAVTFLERKFPERWARALAPQTPVTVSFNLTQTLQRIEQRELTMKDPRGDRPDRPTILDAIRQGSAVANPPLAGVLPCGKRQAC